MYLSPEEQENDGHSEIEYIEYTRETMYRFFLAS